MPTLQEKIVALLKKIKQSTYNAKELADMLALQEKIARDIECEDPVEAMALLGYLLKYKYVTIDPSDGIILNKDKKVDIDLLMKE